MFNPSGLRADVKTLMESYGTPITIKYYTATTYSGTSYDEEYYFVASGTTISGAAIVQALNSSKMAGGDVKYMEQGLLRSDDKKMFVHGSISITTHSLITIGNNGSQYTILPQGVVPHEISGVNIYQTAYIRQYTGGSYYG